MLNGPGGVGKSALALHWLDGVLDRFPHGQLYAELAESTGRPVAVADVLGAFLRALGVPLERVPATLTERAALFRSMTSDRAIAVLLENAVSAAQVKVLVPASGASMVLVTTRRSLPGLLTEGAVAISVPPLDRASATELVERHVGTDRLAPERRPVEDLVKLCAGLPIALCVAAALIAVRPRRSVAGLVDELRDERRRLDVLSVEDDLSVRATFDLSYQELSTRAASAYRVLGRHPGSLVSAELVAAACGTSRAAAVAALDDLLSASLLDEIDEEVYQRHDLVGAHAATVADQDTTDTSGERMRRAVLEWHLFVAQAAGGTVLPARRVLPFTFSGRYLLPDIVRAYRGALVWLERHRLDLAAVIRAAVDLGWAELAYQLGDAIQPLFIVHKHFHEAVEVDQLALDAALALRDPDAETNMRKRLARVLLRLGDLENAQRHIDELLRTAMARGDRPGTASGLKTLGGLHSRRGEHDRAASEFAEAREIVRDLGQHRAEGLVLIDLGMTLIELGRHHEAAADLEGARTILAGLDPPDEYNAARAAAESARAYLGLDDHAAARRLLDEAMPTLARAEAAYELARAHRTLGEVYTATGDPARAHEQYERARVLMAVVEVPAGGDEPY